MAKARKQRQYKRGTTYTITGPTEKEGKFRLTGRGRIGRREVLVFQRVRKLKKRRARKRRSREK
jgi:hypothetical protein